jgi:hypothetical protein
MKGSVHHVNLAVKGNPQALVSCFYFHLIRTQGQKIFIFAQASEQSTQRKRY